MGSDRSENVAAVERVRGIAGAEKLRLVENPCATEALVRDDL
jgi:hypothetical protein